MAAAVGNISDEDILKEFKEGHYDKYVHVRSWFRFYNVIEIDVFTTRFDLLLQFVHFHLSPFERSTSFITNDLFKQIRSASFESEAEVSYRLTVFAGSDKHTDEIERYLSSVDKNIKNFRNIQSAEIEGVTLISEYPKLEFVYGAQPTIKWIYYDSLILQTSYKVDKSLLFDYWTHSPYGVTAYTFNLSFLCVFFSTVKLNFNSEGMPETNIVLRAFNTQQKQYVKIPQSDWRLIYEVDKSNKEDVLESLGVEGKTWLEIDNKHSPAVQTFFQKKPDVVFRSIFDRYPTISSKFNGTNCKLLDAYNKDPYTSDDSKFFLDTFDIFTNEPYSKHSMLIQSFFLRLKNPFPESTMYSKMIESLYLYNLSEDIELRFGVLKDLPSRIPDLQFVPTEERSTFWADYNVELPSFFSEIDELDQTMTLSLSDPEKFKEFSILLTDMNFAYKNSLYWLQLNKMVNVRTRLLPAIEEASSNPELESKPNVLTNEEFMLAYYRWKTSMVTLMASLNRFAQKNGIKEILPRILISEPRSPYNAIASKFTSR